MGKPFLLSSRSPLYQPRLDLGIGKRKWRRRKPIEKQKGGKTPGSELTAGPSAGHVGGGLFFWDKAKAVLATFRKIPERNIDCFNLRRSSAPTRVRRAKVGTAVKSNTVLSKPRYSSFRRVGMADEYWGMALRGAPGCRSHGATAGDRDLLPSRCPSPWPQGYCHTQGDSPRPLW